MNQWRTATAYQACGTSRFESGELTAAIEDFRQMLSILENLKLRNPNVLRYRTGIASAHYNLSLLLLATGDELGYQRMDDCRRGLVESIALSPSNASLTEQYVDYVDGFTRMLAGGGLVDQANTEIDRSIAMLRELDAQRLGFSIVEQTRLDAAREQLLELKNKLAKSPQDATT